TKPKPAPKVAPTSEPKPEVEEEMEAPRSEPKKAKRSTKKSTKSAKKSPKKTSKKVKKSPTKKAVKNYKASTGYFEITSVKQNVIEGNTQSVAKGMLNLPSGETVSKTIVFDQEHLTQKEWTQIGLFMQKGDIVELETKVENDVEFATSLNT
ncbi:MAG: hypothetical protein ACC656_04130, partial [Candidatus Heimdallarchaeota archaeon]